MSTGTLAEASLVRRSRTERMASVRPNTTASGGISPSGWTSVLTLLDVMGFYQYRGEPTTCMRKAKSRSAANATSNLAYVIAAHQLTKGSKQLTLVIPKWAQQ